LSYHKKNYEVKLDTKVNKISDSEQEIEVTLGYDEIKSDIDNAYIKEKANISIPGFRKGKAPLGMIKKMYGEAIEYKVCEDTANKKFWEVIESNGFLPVSAPSLVDLDYKAGEKLTFKVRFQIKPELDVKNYKGIEIEKIIFNVKDTDIEEEINRLKYANSSYEEAEVVDGKDFKLNIDLQRVDENGVPLVGTTRENLDVNLNEPNINPQLFDNSQNKKVNDTFAFNFVDEHMHGDEVHRVDYNYSVEIRKIEKVVLPEETVEFFNKVSRDKASSMDELKNLIKEEFNKYNERQSDELFTNALINKIVENNDFTPPSGYVDTIRENIVKMEKENAKKQGHHFHEILVNEQAAPRAEFTAKWQIILENIARVENLEVTEDDVRALAEQDAEKTGISVDKLIKYYMDSSKKDSLLDDKILNFLKENAVIKEVDAEQKAKEREAEVENEEKESNNE